MEIEDSSIAMLKYLLIYELDIAKLHTGNFPWLGTHPMALGSCSRTFGRAAPAAQ